MEFADMELGTGDTRRSMTSIVPRGMLGLWALLFVIWLVANSTLNVAVAVTGGVITLVLAYVFASSSDAWKKVSWTPKALYHFLAYTKTFIVELIRSNINMMGYVYARRIDIKPGIIEVRTRLKSPIGRLALANSIALTPGSLVIDMEGDALFIHCLDTKTTDIGEATKAMVAPFETHLENIFG